MNRRSVFMILVSISILALFPFSAIADKTIFNETFQNGIGSNWTIVDGYNDTWTWKTVDPADYYIGSPFVNPSAVMRTAGALHFDEQLISPTIDLCDCNGSLKFEFANLFTYYYYGADGVADVDVSTDGGSNWLNILRLKMPTGATNSGSYGPETRTLDVTSIASASSNLKFRFHYYNPEIAYWWFVDEIKLNCVCQPGDNAAPATTATPGGGTYTSTQTVSLSCNDGTGCGCYKTYYTTDGSTPTTASNVYSTPLPISATTTLKFFSEDFAENQSSIRYRSIYDWRAGNPARSKCRP